MPGLSCKSPQSFCNYTSTISGSIADSHKGSVSGLQHRDGDVDTSQLNKFWRELSSSARHELLRIDKHSLFEQARKNMYCSRCNGLLLEAFSQIVSYSKGMQGGSLCQSKHEGGCNKENCYKGDRIAVSNSDDDVRDPSVHPWGGLMATRDNMLTLLDCFLEGQPLEVIQNVCDCARARERERELLYPDACGGGGRGWISQGGPSFARAHSLKETCALHTARLSCDALVDFWSALGEETRRSLLRMKEEDFVDRLMFRFENKRFCRDCRRNVLRELKELKELRRSRKELKCTRWFCNADTAFCYEVSNTSVQANWTECFGGDLESTYQHFEWGLGSTEGNSDILGFEDVGLSEGARVDGLDLANISFFYITLRAWKHDGRCTEISVKAHGLKGRQCVHRRLFVGDGHVTISKGESIKRFFEEAEEAEEEEEDEEVTEKNGSESESDGFRVQRHARSPELAREFLLDAATIIFKEQVEKAFREGTARQNAHTIFVCLALNLLEERIHVACKEISTLEKQKQLLEEEEREKQEEEEKKERRRIKEKEKKLRKKEKQKGKEHMKEDGKAKSQTVDNDCDAGPNEEVCSDDEIKSTVKRVDEDTCVSPHGMPHASSEGTEEEALLASGSVGAFNFLDLSVTVDSKEFQDSNDAFILEHSKAAKRRSKMRKGPLTEIVPPRRFSRRGPYDLSSDPKVSLKSSCSPVIQVTEDAVVGTPKYNSRKVIKPEKSGILSSMETWNNTRYQHRQIGNVCQNLSKRPLYVKSKPSDANSLNMKSLDRKNVVSVTSKQLSRVNNFVTGSVQYNWQIVRTNASDTMTKKGLSDQQHCKVLSNSSLEENENIETPEAECDGSSVMSKSYDSSTPSDCKKYCGLYSRSEKNELENSLEENLFETVESSSTSPNASCGMLTKLIPISTLGSLDEDTSPSSAASFFTDTSDGEVTSNSVTTESSSYLESSATSAEVSTTEISTPATNLEEPHKQSLSCTTTTEEQQKYNIPLFKVDDYHAFNSFPCPELYPYSNDPKILEQHYSVGFEHIPLGMGVEVQAPLIDVASHGYELDSVMMQHGYELDSTMMQHGYELDPTMQLSPSLLPMNPPPSHPFGYSWVQGQCVAAPVLNTFPPHPGNLYIDVGTPVGLTTTLLPFQPGLSVLSFACMPGVPEDSNFTCWGGEPYIVEKQPDVDLFSSRDVFQQHVLPSEEGFCELSSPQVDAVIPALAEPSNDALGFSLFHFGSLPGEEQEKAGADDEDSRQRVVERLEVSCSSTSMQQQESTKSGVIKPNLHAEEYTLFAARPSHRFSFF